MADHYNTSMRSLGSDGKLSEPVNKGYSTNMFSDTVMNYLNNYVVGNKETPFV